MSDAPNLRIPLMMALALHLFLAFVLTYQHQAKNPVLVAYHQDSPGQSNPIDKPVEPIKAVSVDAQELQKTVEKLKNERENQLRAENNRKQQLMRQMQEAQRLRVEEQKKVVALKEEANRLAILRQKHMEEEKKHLAELKQKQLDLKKQQLLESQKLAELKKQQEKAQALAKANELAKKQREAAALARQIDERNARMAGEVDKYKALIIGAISRQWILPENANRMLSSQFRIRLAPNGSVLDVVLTRGSGDAVLDRSAQAAIYKASPLPVPADPTAFNLFRSITLTVRPENARG